MSAQASAQGAALAAWRTAGERLICDRRLGLIAPSDLRYGWSQFGEYQSLAHLLEDWLGASVLEPDRMSFVERLCNAYSRSLAEDIRDISAALARASYADEAAIKRSAHLFAARHGAAVDDSALERLGDEQGCSGERVRQIVTRVAECGRRFNIFSFAVEELLERSAAVREIAESNHQLAAMLLLDAGPAHSLDGVRRLCSRVLRIPAARTALLSAPSEPRAPFVKRVREHCAKSGAAHLPTIAGELSFVIGRNLRREELERLVDAIPGTRWLDRTDGWFTVEFSPRSFIRRRLREMVAVAKQPLRLAEIMAALLSQPCHKYRAGENFVPVPLDVFRTLIAGWDEIEIDGSGSVRDRSGVRAEDLLSDAHLRLYRALARRGGLAKTEDLVSEVQSGLSRKTAWNHIQQAPFVSPVGRTHYSLRGWPVSQDTFLALGLGAATNEIIVVSKGT